LKKLILAKLGYAEVFPEDYWKNSVTSNFHLRGFLEYVIITLLPLREIAL